MKGWKKRNSVVPDSLKPPPESAGTGNIHPDDAVGDDEVELQGEFQQLERDLAAEDTAGEDEDEDEADEDEDGYVEKTYHESEEVQIEEGDGEAENGRPKLAEGFYEIESVRRKRVRKGKLQYLIKWRGWPETANTWEPVGNLMSCADVIDAFEESLQSGKHQLTRKRKGKYGATTDTQPKKKQQQQYQQKQKQKQKQKQQQKQKQKQKQKQQRSPAAATYSVPAVKVRIIEEPTPSPPLNDLEATNRVENSGSDLNNSKVDIVVNCNGLKLDSSKEITEQNELNLKLSELKGATSTSENSVDRSGNGLSNGFPKANGAESFQSGRHTGARKRKSGSVRRFKQDTTPGVMDDAQIAAVSSPIVQEGILNHEIAGNDLGCKNKPEDSKDAYAITQIVKPMSYSASLANDVQDILVTFHAKRSDGKDVMVDNKTLKMNNPLLLIDFYEQHLRYHPSHELAEMKGK